MIFRNLLLIACLAASPAFAQQPPPAKPVDATEDQLREPIPEKTDPTAAKLFATSVKAQGGADKILIDSIQADVKFTSGPEVTEIQLWAERPNKARTEYHFRKLGKDYSITKGLNEEGAWVYDTTRERPFPQSIGGDDKALLESLAPGDEILLSWEEKGCVLEYLGTVNNRQQKHYLVKLYYPDGLTEYFYFHAKNYLLTRRGKKIINQGVAVNTDVQVLKYENIQGGWFPTKVQTLIEDEPVMDIEYTNIKLNEPIDDELFAIPKVKEVWLRKEK